MLRSFRDHTFLTGPLGSSSVVWDLGAHRGEFANEVARSYKAKVLAVEANPKLAEGITPGEGVEVVWAAAGSTDDAREFNLSDAEEASSLLDHDRADATETVSVPGITLGQLLERSDGRTVDLVKIDIEGAEVELLTNAKAEELQAISQIAIEFHGFAGLVTDAEVASVRQRLNEAGFRDIRFSRNDADWLFFKPERCGVSGLQELRIRHIDRNIFGIKRIVDRKLKR